MEVGAEAAAGNHGLEQVGPSVVRRIYTGGWPEAASAVQAITGALARDIFARLGSMDLSSEAAGTSGDQAVLEDARRVVSTWLEPEQWSWRG
jgi:hypothetical protein